MSIFVGLFYFFSSFCVLSAIFVVITKNPIFSILFLILAFVNVSCSLFLFSFEFLPISFLVVYVGAIAILFLFVLMMLNIKLAVLNQTYNNFIPFALLFFFAFLFEFFLFFGHEFVYLNLSSSDSTLFFFDFVNRSSSVVHFSDLLTLFSNLKIISFSIFSNFLFEFLIGGFILLLAMVASISLTLQKLFISKSQNFYAQILTDFNTTLTTYKRA